MCSIRSGCRQCPLAPRPAQCNRSIRKNAGYLTGQTVKLEFEERRGFTMWESTHPTITGPLRRACPDALHRYGWVCAEGRLGDSRSSDEPRQKGHDAADVRYPDQHASEMAAQSALPTVIPYFARPDSCGSLGSTEAPSGPRVFVVKLRFSVGLGHP